MKRSIRIGIMLGLMRTMRPLLGPIDMCIYREYTCTDYAVDQLTHHALPIAIVKILWRGLKCNPLTMIIQRLKQ